MGETLRLACIPGDGIGPEVVAASLPILQTAAALDAAQLDVVELDWGGEYYLRNGVAMPPDAVETPGGCDTVLRSSHPSPDGSSERLANAVHSTLIGERTTS